MKKSSFAKADFSRSSKSERNLIKTPLLCMRNKINSQKSFSNKEKQEKKRFSSCFCFFARRFVLYVIPSFSRQGDIRGNA